MSSDKPIQPMSDKDIEGLRAQIRALRAAKARISNSTLAAEGLIARIEVERIRAKRMNLDDYQAQAKRTAGRHQTNEVAVSNWAMGLAGETGELIDLLKKHLFHGKILDRNKVRNEAGDVLWYLSNLCHACEISLSDAAAANIEKLKVRYPNGFVEGGGIRDET